MTIVPSCVSDERVQRLILESSTASWSLNHCRPLIVKPCKTRLHFKWVALLITAWTSTVVQTLVTTQVRSRHYSVHIPGHLFGFFVGSFLSSAHPHLLRLFKPIYFPFCIIWSISHTQAEHPGLPMARRHCPHPVIPCDKSLCMQPFYRVGRVV